MFSFFARALLPWLIPVLVCGVLGAYALALIHRTRFFRPAAPPRSLGLSAWLALCFLFGLRIVHLILVLLGALRVGFRLSLVLVGLLSMGAGAMLWAPWKKRGQPTQPEVLAPPIHHRRELTEAEAGLVAFILMLLFCALHAEPGGWDVFTHWLVVPNEILSFDRMAYYYGTTRSVAPDYPTHQIVLGAFATLMSGGRDGIANSFCPLFLCAGALATLETVWVLAKSRLLTALALLGVLAIAGSPEIVFGYFYGDALVIAVIAFALLGLAYLVKYRGRSSPVIVWACLSMPLVAKGIGFHLCIFGAVIFASWRVWSCRKRPIGSPEWKAAGILLAALALELVLPRVLMIGMVSNYVQPRPAAQVLTGSVTGMLATAFANVCDTSAMLALGVAVVLAPVLALVRPRRFFRTSQKWVVPLFVVYALAVMTIFAGATLLAPDSRTSWPRYATMGGPVLGILLTAGLVHARPWRVMVSVPLLSAGLYVLFITGYHGYIDRHSIWIKGSLDSVPLRDELFLTRRAFYENLRKAVDPVHGRVFFIQDKVDQMLPYQISKHFAMAGIRAPFYSRSYTAPANALFLFKVVDEWLTKNGAKGPPPAELKPATDFLFFNKPMVISGRPFRDLVRLDAFLAATSR